MTQLTAADLKRMTPEQIVKAQDEGRCAALLGATPDEIAALDKARSTEPLTLADLNTLAALGRHDLIAAAHSADRITTTTATATTEGND